MERPEQIVIPYLTVVDAAAAIAFYQGCFAAKEQFRLTAPDGKIGHAELRIGQAALMLADEHPGGTAKAPVSVGGTSVLLHLNVDDPDAVVEQAQDAGATIVRRVADQFYGERSGVIADPFGHVWIIATRIEEVSPEEMQDRFTGGGQDDVAKA